MVNIVLIAQTPEWQWAAQAGGFEWDAGMAISLDDAGNSYVTGFFRETATFGSYSLTSSDNWDIFVAKIDTDGNWLWATQASGSSFDEGYALTIDDAGNSYVTGSFWDIATFGSYSLTSSGISDIFVAKIDGSGNWQWATKAGGTSEDEGYEITIDDVGNSYVTGYFRETSTFGSFTLTSNGYGDIFVAKMNANGNWLWATQGGGSSFDVGHGITVDNAGNSYVTGWFRDYATFGSYFLISNSTDIFVAKIDGSGNWQWATKAGGSNVDVGYGITIDDDRNSYVTGRFKGTATFGSYSLTCSVNNDIFVAKMDADGSWQWATRAGGTDYDCGDGITIDSTRNIYVTGYFAGTATFGSYSLISSGYSDIFVAKMDANGNWLWATQAGGIDTDKGYGITIDDAENSYVTGSFWDIATFGSYSLTSNGTWDIFIAKLNCTLSVENEISPTVNSLSNYPNPFNPCTTISFSTTEHTESTDIIIYNIKGQKIRTFQIPQSAIHNQNSVVWDGTDNNNKPVSSGIYFYRLINDVNKSDVKKMLLLK